MWWDLLQDFLISGGIFGPISRNGSPLVSDTIFWRESEVHPLRFFEVTGGAIKCQKVTLARHINEKSTNLAKVGATKCHAMPYDLRAMKRLDF